MAKDFKVPAYDTNLTNQTKRYNDEIKTEFANRWSESYHDLSRGVPKDAYRFGLVISDWEDHFKDRLKRIKLHDKDSIKELNKYNMEIPFQYVQEIPIQMKGVNWADEVTMGRYEQQKVYSYSNTMDYSLNITYVAEASEGSNSAWDDYNNIYNRHRGTAWTMTDLDRCILKLQSLAFPQYDGMYGPPATCLLNMGNVVVDQPIVIRNVNVTHEPPYETTTMKSMIRKITLEITTVYPPWQALSGAKIYTGDNAGILAYQEFKKIE